MRKEVETFLKVLVVTVILVHFAAAANFSDIVCPNKHTKCQSNQTCCSLGQQRYGCCPYAGATCCSDLQSCCPHGYQCDVTAHRCIRSRLSNPVKNIRPWITIEQPQTLPFTNDTFNEVELGNGKKLCPDGIQTCPESFTCCEQVSGRYGCCPLTGALCCADKVHCCPMGTQCSSKLGGSCES